MCAAFQSGANAYLTKTIATPVLISSLGFVMDNASVAPAAAMIRLAQARDGVRDGANTSPSPCASLEIDPLTSHVTIMRDQPSAHIQKFASSEDGCSAPDLATVLRAHKISDREANVFDLVAKGASNKSIAIELQITEATVKVHIKSILRKIGVKSRTHAALWAINQSRAKPMRATRPVNQNVESGVYFVA
jgi:DNA-binding NarL/FixJ family response regulator